MGQIENERAVSRQENERGGPSGFLLWAFGRVKAALWQDQKPTVAWQKGRFQSFKRQETGRENGAMAGRFVVNILIYNGLVMQSKFEYFGLKVFLFRITRPLIAKCKDK